MVKIGNSALYLNLIHAKSLISSLVKKPPYIDLVQLQKIFPSNHHTFSEISYVNLCEFIVPLTAHEKLLFFFVLVFVVHRKEQYGARMDIVHSSDMLYKPQIGNNWIRLVQHCFESAYPQKKRDTWNNNKQRGLLHCP